MTRRLSFPTLELNRLPAPEHTVMPKNARYKGVTENLRPRFADGLERMHNELPQKLLTYYDKADRVYAMQVYAGWNELQRNLALLSIKPKAIERIYADYQNIQNLVVSEIVDDEQINSKLVSIEKTDFVFDNFDNDCVYFFRKIEILNQYLPYSIRLSIWQLLATDFLRLSSDTLMSFLENGVYDLLLDYPKEGFDIAIKLLPLMNQNAKFLKRVLFLAEHLDSHICVPYVIMGMNSLRMKRDANPQVFLLHFPETFYNELVYILFTKPSNDWYRKAQVNAKKLLHYMIDNELSADNYLIQLRAATHRYDAYIKSDPLTDFLNQYIDNYQQIRQEKQALNEAESTITMVTEKQIDINDDGVPQSLLNTDWQKQTRKRKFELDETIYVKESAETQLPILEALTPPIIASTNKPLTIAAFKQLLLMLKLSTEDKPIPALAEVLPVFTSDSLIHLANELWNDYIVNRVAGGHFPDEDPLVYGVFNTNKKWFITSSAWMADESLADKVWQFIKDYESESHVRSSVIHSFKVLAALASTYPNSKRNEVALKMLIKISNKSRSTLRPHAKAALENYAKHLNLRLEDLAERLLPDFGLDERGTKVIDYNPSVADSRKLTVSLTPRMTFTYQDETGKSYKTPPKAREIDDVDVVNEFLDQHNVEKKELRAISTNLPKTLEKMMIAQRTVSLADFMTYYVQHPVMTVLAQGLVWQVQVVGEENSNANNKNTANTPTFRVSESLELLDIEDIALNDTQLTNALISLLHPVHLSLTEIQQWADMFSDYELIQPVSQLSRPLYWLTDEEQSSGTVHRFDEVRWAMGSLIGLQNHSKGWDAFSHGGGRCDGFDKMVNGYLLSIALHNGFMLGEPAHANDLGYRIECIGFPQDVDKVTVSELLREIDEMARVS